MRRRATSLWLKISRKVRLLKSNDAIDKPRTKAVRNECAIISEKLSNRMFLYLRVRKRFSCARGVWRVRKSFSRFDSDAVFLPFDGKKPYVFHRGLKCCLFVYFRVKGLRNRTNVYSWAQFVTSVSSLLPRYHWVSRRVRSFSKKSLFGLFPRTQVDK